MDEEFRKVTRKKWIARRSLKHNRKPQKTNSFLISDKIDSPFDNEAFMQKIKCACERMKESKYFGQSMIIINEAIKRLNGEDSAVSQNENSKNLLTQKSKTCNIVCLGLGLFTENLLAFHQFAFILSVQNSLSAQSDNSFHSFYYDPVFSIREQKILQDLKCTLLKENTEGRYPLEGKTLFYLPHCPNALTNNLLESNWFPEQLDKIILINNSFLNLSLSKPERLLRSDSNLILDILPFTEEIPLIDNYFISGIFNDLSLHIFPYKRMPSTDDTNFWQKRRTKSVVDYGELIINQSLKQLKITS